jgi:hypothetical protein
MTRATVVFSFAIANLASLVAPQAFGASLTITRTLSHPTQEMVDASGGGLTLNSQIAKFFVTTDADILSVNQVLVTVTGGSLYQVPAPFGSNTEPPHPAFLAFNASLAADSWISTPGATSRLGGDLPGDGTGSWGDLTNDGPQNSFHFATLTIPSFASGARATFTGRITLAGANGPEAYPIAIVPEPCSGGLLSLGLISLASFRRIAAQGRRKFALI